MRTPVAAREQLGSATDGFWLYRLYNDAGQLLYVASPASPRTRLLAHLCRKDWFGEIAHIEVQEFRSLEAALAEEAVALVAEDAQP